jgi:hypothetical protein
VVTEWRRFSWARRVMASSAAAGTVGAPRRQSRAARGLCVRVCPGRGGIIVCVCSSCV